MSIRAVLNGVPLVGSAINKWRFKEGVRPVVETLTIAERNVHRIIPLGGKILGSTLIVDDGETRPLVVKKLTIIGLLPGEDPHTRRIVVADRRWLWRYKWVLRRFNIRKRGAFQRRGKWNEKLQPTPTQEVTYARWSLDPLTNAPWRPRRAMLSVLTDDDAIALKESDVFFDKSLGVEFQTLDLENVELDDRGHLSLQRTLQSMPGTALYVDEDGDVVIYQRNSGFEARVLEESGHEIQQGGHVDFVTNEEVRPEFVDVYFTIEAEVRFNFRETSSRTFAKPNIDQRDLDNVLPCPDFQLNLADGRKVTQGTWLEFADFLDSAVVKAGRGLLEGLSVTKWFKLIRQAFIPELNLWSAMLMVGILTPNSDEQDWAARVAAIEKHFRTTFRISPRWLDRILSMKDYLVGTIDPANGQRAPAIAFADHAIKTNFKGFVHLARNGKDMRYATNVTGYNDNLDNAVPAPATVSISDPDQGIIRIDYQTDPYNLEDKVFPSKIDNLPGPGVKEAKKGRHQITMDATIRKGSAKPSLSANHRMAVVITCVPASPNNKRQLYRIRIKADDVRTRLPSFMRNSLNKTNKGLVEEVRIGAGFETARVRWKDTRSRDIEKIFGVIPGDPDFNDLIINDKPGQGAVSLGGGTAASIREIALAAATAVYASYNDRFMGSKTVHGKGGLLPAGTMGEIVHEVGTDGKFTTSLDLPDEIETLDIFAFLNDSTRRIILKNAQATR